MRGHLLRVHIRAKRKTVEFGSLKVIVDTQSFSYCRGWAPMALEKLLSEACLR